MRIAPFNPLYAVIFGVIAMASPALFIKLAGDAPSAIIALYRLLFAVLAMTPVILVKYRQEFKKIQGKDWLVLLMAGTFFALHLIFWFESFNHTSVASSVILMALQPIVAFILTYFFYKARYASGTIVSLIIALFGTYIILSGDRSLGEGFFYGDILALIGTLFITLYFLVGKRLGRRISFLTYTFAVYSISTLIVFIYSLTKGHAFTTYDPSQWVVFIALALLPTFLGYTAFNWALKWVQSATITFGLILSPIISTALTYFFLDEPITGAQLLGSTVILFGLFLFTVSTTRKRRVTISTDIPKK